MITFSDVPGFTSTVSLSAFTSFSTKSALSGMAAGSVPVGGPDPGVILPKGVWRSASWSTYQYHFPCSSFHVLGIGTFMRLAPQSPAS